MHLVPGWSESSWPSILPSETFDLEAIAEEDICSKETKQSLVPVVGKTQYDK